MSRIVNTSSIVNTSRIANISRMSRTSIIMYGFAHLSVLLCLFKMKQDGPEIKGASKIYPPFKFSVLL